MNSPQTFKGGVPGPEFWNDDPNSTHTLHRLRKESTSRKLILTQGAEESAPDERIRATPEDPSLNEMGSGDGPSSGPVGSDNCGSDLVLSRYDLERHRALECISTGVRSPEAPQLGEPSLQDTGAIVEGIPQVCLDNLVNPNTTERSTALTECMDVVESQSVQPNTEDSPDVVMRETEHGVISIPGCTQMFNCLFGNVVHAAPTSTGEEHGRKRVAVAPPAVVHIPKIVKREPQESTSINPPEAKYVDLSEEDSLDSSDPRRSAFDTPVEEEEQEDGEIRDRKPTFLDTCDSYLKKNKKAGSIQERGNCERN